MQVEIWLSKISQVEIVHFASWNCPFRKLNFDFASWICDFATCEIVFQLGAVVFQWPKLLYFSSDLHTVWSDGLLTSRASKRYIVCIKWTPGSTRNVSFSCSPLEFLRVRFLSLFFLIAFLIGFGNGLRSSKAWILDVNELPFSFPWIIQSSPSILDCFGDKKAIKNTKT